MTDSAPSIRLESLRPWPAGLNIPVYLLLWSIPGLAALSFYYLTQTVTAGSFNWTYALVSTLPNWYIWAVLAPVVVKVASTWPMDSSNWLRVLLTVHVPVMFAAMMVHSLFNLILFRTAGLHDVMNLDLYRVHFTTRVHANIFTYATIVGAWYAFDYYRKYASRERQAASLQIQLAQANLRALKMQIHPHFLFNTLNSISALVRKEENRLAVRMLGQLGEFLRIALENKGQQEIPLEQEFDFLRKYLDIELVRFGDRLEVNFDVDPELRTYYVPNLILQPIVENAIHHGISQQTSGGRIDVVAREENGRICMSVSDNGPGLKNPERLEKGVGVANTQARLENLYGSDQEFSLRNASSGGLEVRVCVPKCAEPVIRFPDEQS